MEKNKCLWRILSVILNFLILGSTNFNNLFPPFPCYPSLFHFKTVQFNYSLSQYLFLLAKYHQIYMYSVYGFFHYDPVAFLIVTLLWAYLFFGSDISGYICHVCRFLGLKFEIKIKMCQPENKPNQFVVIYHGKSSIYMYVLQSNFVYVFIKRQTI